MKKRNWIMSSVLAGSILTMGAAGAAYASCDSRKGGDYHGDKMMHVMKKLDLSDEQKESIRNIKSEQKEQMKASKDSMKDIRKALREQANADNYDAAKVQELANAKAKIMEEMTVKRTENMNRIRKELTAEQLTKLDSMQERKFKRGDY